MKGEGQQAGAGAGAAGAEAAAAAILGGAPPAGGAPLGAGAAGAAAAGAGGAAEPQWKYTPASADELALIPMPKGVLGDKYKTIQDMVNGASSAIAQRDTYASKLKGFTGAPVGEDGKTPNYTFVVPEGFEAEIDTKHPLYADLVGKLAKAGASQEFYNDLMGMLVQYESGRDAVDTATTMQELADAYHTPELRDAKLSELNSFLMPLLDDEARGLLRDISVNAKVVRFLDRLKGAWTASNIPVNIEGGVYGADAIVAQAEKDPKSLMTDNQKLANFEKAIQAQNQRRR